MCEVTRGFRLCTCASDEPAQWVLQRRDLSLPEHHYRGRVARPRFSEQQELDVDVLLAGLNGGEAFDFAFVATEGDVFVLEGEEANSPLRFRFERGRWVRDQSTSFASWRDQMVHLHDGVLKE